MAIALGWVVLAAVLFAMLAFAFALVRHFSDAGESSKLSKAAVVLALFVQLLTVLLLPLDVFAVASGTDAVTGAQIDADATAANAHGVKILYFSAFNARDLLFTVVSCDPCASSPCLTNPTYTHPPTPRATAARLAAVFYSAVGLFGFVLLPFAFFFYEEDEDDLSLGERVCAAFKVESSDCFVSAFNDCAPVYAISAEMNCGELWSRSQETK